MTLIEIAGAGLASLLLIATLAWLYGLFARTPVVLERWWGVGLMVVNTLFLSLSAQRNWRDWLVFVLVSLWAVRHLYLSLRWPLRERSLLTSEYVRSSPLLVLRKHYLFQAVQIFGVSAPLFAIYTSYGPKGLTVFDVIGLLCLLIGFHLATRGSHRLERLHSKVGTIMKEPHHYGEITLWSGFYILALSVPSGYLTLFSPVLINRHLRRFVRPNKDSSKESVAVAALEA